MVADTDDGVVVVAEELILVGDVDIPNNERSSCWNATVMGCAHMLIRPDTAVNNPESPSSEEVKAPSAFGSANTVVTPGFVNTLVHPKYCAVTPPALTVLIKVVYPKLL